MGVLKPIKITLKVAATAVLGVTGAVSAVLETVGSNESTFTGPNILTAVKEASFDGIKTLWNENDAMNTVVDNVDSFATSAADAVQQQAARAAREAEKTAKKSNDAARRRAAQAAYNAAMNAKKSGDMERYQKIMDKYQELK